MGAIIDATGDTPRLFIQGENTAEATRQASIALSAASGAAAANSDAQDALTSVNQVAATLPAPYYTTLAGALADAALTVGRLFMTDESGLMVVYKRTAGSPGYVALPGQLSSKVNTSDLADVAGASLVGIRPGGPTGNMRTLLAKMGELEVSIADYGAVADSTGRGVGTDNGPAICKAILYVFINGGGVVKVPTVAQPSYDQPLETRNAYGFKGTIVVPSGVRIIGAHPMFSVLRKIDSQPTAPPISVGTFGPSNGTSLSSCPKYVINDIPASAAPGCSVKCATASDAANFAVHDIVGIEGSQYAFGNTGQYTPNLCARVTGVNTSTGVITLDNPIDNFGYVTTGSIKPGIRKLSNNAITALTDANGHAWPLACAVESGMENLGIDTDTSTSWATPNLSTYKCRFRDLEINGWYVAGDPCAYTLFERITLHYYGTIFELAYMSHDSDFVDIKANRHPDGVSRVSGSALIWVNQSEGAKRCNFSRMIVADRADLTSSTVVQALWLTNKSTLRHSRFTIPMGYLGYTQADCTVEDNDLYANAANLGVTAGVAVYGDTWQRNRVRVDGTSSQMIVAQQTCSFVDNLVGDHSNAPTTLTSTAGILLSTGASNSRRRGNRTARFSGEPLIANVTYQQTSANTVTSFTLMDVPSSTFQRLLGYDWKVRVNAYLQWTGTGKFKITLNAYDSTGALYPLVTLDTTSAAIAAATGHFTIDYQHHEPGTANASYDVILKVGNTTYGSVINYGGTIAGASVVGFNLSVTGMTSGDTFAIQSGEMFQEPMGSTI